MLVAAALATGCGAPSAGPLASPPPPAPAQAARAPSALVLRGGTIYTLDIVRPRADVAVIVDGRFACVGTSSRCAIPAGATVLDLAGGSATPGLADAHGHVVSLGLEASEVDLRGCANEAACVDRLVARAARTPKGAWIEARGWDQTRWPGQRFPTSGALSRAVPDHPVFARRVDGHAAWVNARALELAGIGPRTPDPPGGHLERDAAGAPEGVLVDNAQELVGAKIPPPTAPQIESAILTAADALVAVGLTSVHDAGVGPEALAVYARLAAEDRLKVRVDAMLDGSQPMEALQAAMETWRRHSTIGWLTVRSVKMYADGAMGSRGARMFEPYADDPGTSGLAVTEPGELRRRILAVANAGFQPAVHAIGDRACAEVLADFVEASKLAPDLRPRVEHLQVLRASDVHLLTAAGAVASMQPTHATSDGPWAEARLGHGTVRQKGAYAWRQVLDAGAVLACGSDFPVEDIDPRAGLYSAEARTWPGGPAGGWMPEQKLSRQEALRCFTTGAAAAAHAESHRGVIREGYDADVTVFAKDVFAVDVSELRTIPVAFTIVGGRVEFSSRGR
jgi:predicted amidohydrolase YtcJ